MELITAFLTVVAVLVVTFVVDAVARWWRQNAWKRRWRERDGGSDSE